MCHQGRLCQYEKNANWINKFNVCVYIVLPKSYYLFHFTSFRLFVIKIADFSHWSAVSYGEPWWETPPGDAAHLCLTVECADCALHAGVGSDRSLWQYKVHFQSLADVFLTTICVDWVSCAEREAALERQQVRHTVLLPHDSTDSSSALAAAVTGLC